KARTTQKYSDLSELREEIEGKGSFTMFAPSDKAWDLLDPVSRRNCILILLTVEIGCDGDSLTVNGIKMVLKKDIVTTNGVIHLINQVLIPDSAKEVMELVGESQSTFRDMVSELGLSAAMKPKTEYTLLSPLNTAFSDEVMSLDQSVLKVILENHILKQKHKLSELYNGQLLETIAGDRLRVFIYRTVSGRNASTCPVLCVQCWHLSSSLSSVLAPSFHMSSSLSDVNALRTILLYHFSNGVFINGGLEAGVTNLLKTIQGHNLQVNKSIHVNSLDVPDIDLMATNGVIHVVKNVLYPGDLPVGRESLLVLLKKLIKYIQIKVAQRSVFIYISFLSYLTPTSHLLLLCFSTSLDTPTPKSPSPSSVSSSLSSSSSSSSIVLNVDVIPACVCLFCREDNHHDNSRPSGITRRIR
uniref:Periostin, osteoblast specific factor a n=1 Tax=Hucho hucho TaxID=62062 RepID=A0A4W5QU12_9TELE